MSPPVHVCVMSPPALRSDLTAEGLDAASGVKLFFFTLIRLCLRRLAALTVQHLFKITEDAGVCYDWCASKGGMFKKIPVKVISTTIPVDLFYSGAPVVSLRFLGRH